MSDGSAALTLGERTAGTLAAAGDRLRYAFTLDSATRLLFDSLTNNANIVWTLTGPAGVVDSRDFVRSDALNRTDAMAFFAAAGDYVLTVDGTGDTAGDFAFRLLDLAAATPLTLGAVTSGTIEHANATALYRVTGAAGHRLFFDYLTYSSDGRWRLPDPHGKPIGSAAGRGRGVQ